MSQRRSVAAATAESPALHSASASHKTATQVPVGSLELELSTSLDSTEVVDHQDEKLLLNEPEDHLDLEKRYQIERHHNRLKHWRESAFAVGLVEPTWREEQWRTRHQYGDDELQRDESGCLCCSAYACAKFGRVGNMVVLKSSNEWVEEVEMDDGTNEEKVRRYMRPKLDCVVGPYWPMMVCVTYPLILGVSGWTFFAKVITGRLSPLVVLGWTVLTVGLIMALAFTACCDPGIQYKCANPPPQQENLWRWTDRALSYRSRRAFYDVDTAVVVEGFDHTCPWTGTAIGKKNLVAFQVFVTLIFVCMMMNIFLLTGVFDVKFG